MTTGQFPGTPGFDSPGHEETSRTGAEGSTDSGLKEQAQQVAGTAGEQGKQVAGTAKDEAGHVAAEAKNQFSTLLSEATTQVDDQSRVQKDRLAETLRTFGDDLGSMAEQGSGMAADLAQEVAQRARDISSRLQDRDPQDLLEDVRGFARRKPGTFLLGALAAGVVAGRVARGAKAAKDAESAGSTGYQATGTHRAGVPETGYSSGVPADVPGTAYPTTGATGTPTYGSPGVATPPDAESGLGLPPTPPPATPPGPVTGTGLGGPGARP
ncbi:hypothetical protein [Nocardioides solisilvae]|uniref:hypothetical protein n=1 Tax=Nocardioides solisilvae TaxID=1542435 RepID=UPI000D741EF2|nr:hypothetical protein [Nocardioides solisilvae]